MNQGHIVWRCQAAEPMDNRRAGSAGVQHHAAGILLLGERQPQHKEKNRGARGVTTQTGRGPSHNNVHLVFW